MSVYKCAGGKRAAMSENRTGSVHGEFYCHACELRSHRFVALSFTRVHIEHTQYSVIVCIHSLYTKVLDRHSAYNRPTYLSSTSCSTCSSSVVAACIVGVASRRPQCALSSALPVLNKPCRC